MRYRLINFTAKLAATGLGLGYCPLVPGTIGSLLGVAIYILLINQTFLTKAITLAALFMVGIICSTRAERLFAEKDSRKIIIDEVAGCFLFLIFVPYNIWAIILGFIIFRLLDIIKPFPANASQRLPGGLGIMADDFIAGIYTAIIVNFIFLLKNNLCLKNCFSF